VGERIAADGRRYGGFVPRLPGVGMVRAAHWGVTCRKLIQQSVRLNCVTMARDFVFRLTGSDICNGPLAAANPSVVTDIYCKVLMNCLP
jgi:hypothetical protein